VRNRFVKPEIVRLPLSGGDWLDVKRRLTSGEMRQVVRAALAESSTVIVAREMAEWLTSSPVTTAGRLKAAIIDPSLVEEWQKKLTTSTSAATRSMDITHAQILAYVVAWSFTDEGGAVPVDAYALDMLNPDDYREIEKAVDAHEEEQQRQRAAEKKAQDGEPASSAISSSSETSTSTTLQG
jgi:hypothetical protein